MDDVDSPRPAIKAQNTSDKFERKSRDPERGSGDRRSSQSPLEWQATFDLRCFDTTVNGNYNVVKGRWGDERDLHHLREGASRDQPRLILGQHRTQNVGTQKQWDTAADLSLLQIFHRRFPVDRHEFLWDISQFRQFLRVPFSGPYSKSQHYVCYVDVLDNPNEGLNNEVRNLTVMLCWLSAPGGGLSRMTCRTILQGMI